MKPRTMVVTLLTTAFAYSAHAPGLRAQGTTSWQTHESPTYNYAIKYASEYRGDVAFVERWMDFAFNVASDKYGLITTPCKLEIYLYPPDSEEIRSGKVSVHTVFWTECPSSAGGNARIHYFTPSIGYRYERENSDLRSWIGLVYGSTDYQAKLIIHEAMNFLLWSIRDRMPRGAIPYHGGFPSWFGEGLSDYEGQQATEYLRTTGLNGLLDHISERRRDTFSCCWGLGPHKKFYILDVYHGGNLFVWFLADEFGADIHVDLMNTRAPSFAEALDLELEVRDTDLQNAFNDFQNWFAEKRPLRAGQTIEPVPTDQHSEDTKRLRRLVTLLQELLGLTTP